MPTVPSNDTFLLSAREHLRDARAELLLGARRLRAEALPPVEDSHLMADAVLEYFKALEALEEATEAENRIRAEAARDAKSFAAEFPGELLDPASTDWDSTAWDMAPADLRAIPGGWESYQRELVSHVRALVDLQALQAFRALRDGTIVR